MHIVFDLAFDGGCCPGPLQGREAVVGEAWVGPLGFLQLLETRLGLGGRRHSVAKRAATLVPALTAQAGFWSRSVSVDPLGTAFELLRWRDRLWQCGWRGQAVSPRLAELACVTATVLPGIPDRLAAVNTTLVRRNADIASVTLFRAPDMLPAAWQGIVSSLQGQGTQLEVKRIDAASATGDLRGARSPGFRPKGDGSLVLLRPHGPLEAAEEVAAWLANEPSLGSTVVIGGEPLLDAALHRFGLPTTGASGGVQDNLLLEVLPLVLELCWDPAHPQRVFELLSLPEGPVRPSIARRLVRALGAWPSIESDEWHEALAKGLAGIEDEGQRARVQQRLAGLFEPRVKGPLCPAKIVADRAAALAGWFSERAALKQGSDAPDAVRFLEGHEQCEVLLDLLKATAATELTRDQIRTLISVATDESGGSSSFHAEAGLAAVTAPGAVVGPAERILWWDFRRDTAPSVRFLPLTGPERASLSDAGVVLPDPGAEAVGHAESWRRPLLSARTSLVLVCPREGANGEEVFPHPLWDEILASLDNDAGRARLERFAPPLFAEPPRKRRKKLPQASMPERLEVQASLLVVRKTESPSSLGTLVGCPLRWVLEYIGHLEDSVSVDTSASNMNLGKLAHLVIERFLLRADRDPDHAEEQAGALFDELAPRLVSSLYLAGADNVRTQVRQSIARSAADLDHFLREKRRTIISVEQAYQSKALAREVCGYPDLVFGPKPLVIDLKWSGATYHQEALASGAAYQLAAYSFLIGSERNASFPPVAYFIVQNQRCLTTDAKAFGDAEVTDGPSPKDTWNALAKGSTARYRELKKGHVLRPSTPDPGQDSAVGIINGQLALKPPCGFCAYGILCGETVGG